MGPSLELGSHTLNESACVAWNISCLRSLDNINIWLYKVEMKKHELLSKYFLPEITISSEDFVALVALVRLVVGVGEQVSLQVRPLVETPLTHRTLVRRLLLKTLLFSQILHSTKER